MILLWVQNSRDGPVAKADKILVCVVFIDSFDNNVHIQIMFNIQSKASGYMCFSIPILDLIFFYLPTYSSRLLARLIGVTSVSQ